MEQAPGPGAVHRRSMRIAVGPVRGGARAVDAQLSDRRYRGVSRVGIHVRRPGPIHEMSAHLEIDARGRAIASARGAMALAAFDGTPDTGFQSCRDILPNVAHLAGLPIDAELVAAMRRTVGRERGCYHLSTLILATAPVLARIAREALAAGPFGRELVLDAADAGGGLTRFDGMLRDWQDGAPERRARLAFSVSYARPRAGDVLAMRAPGLAPAPDAAARLEGTSLETGFAREALARLADLPEAAELGDLALGLSAIFTQGMVQAPGSNPAPIPAGRAHRAHNTCWMWRDGGPLQGMSSGLEEE
jgi:hypothetical protein